MTRPGMPTIGIASAAFLALALSFAPALVADDGGAAASDAPAAADVPVVPGAADAPTDAAPSDDAPDGEAAKAKAAEVVVPAYLEDPGDILARLPAVTVLPRKDALKEKGDFPCSDCHAELEADVRVRELVEAHDEVKLMHGGGRFWCLTCHDAGDRDQLRSLDGKPIDFDQSFLLCGQCHFRPQRDFFHGAHGKRVGTYTSAGALTPCTGCHDAHDPGLKKRKPLPVEKPREGLLAPSKRVIEHRLPFERHGAAGEHGGKR